MKCYFLRIPIGHEAIMFLYYIAAKINHKLTGYQDKNHDHNTRQRNPFNVVKPFWGLPLPALLFKACVGLEFSHPMSSCKLH